MENPCVLGEQPSCSFGVGGQPRGEINVTGPYYCYQCCTEMVGKHTKKLYYGYDITVCLGECDRKWDERLDKHGFS